MQSNCKLCNQLQVMQSNCIVLKRCVTPDYNGGLSVIKYYILNPSILMFKSLNFKMSPKPLLKNRIAQVIKVFSGKTLFMIAVTML